jgi:hypothetical protein
VSAGNTDGILVMAHDSAPSLCTFVDGDATGNGTGNFGVAVADSGGANYNVALTQILGIVADCNLNAQLTQMQNRFAFGHIGTLNFHAHPAQNFCQRAHGNAADTNQMDFLSGNQIIVNRTGVVHHKKDILSNAFCVAGTRKALYNHYKASYYITGKLEKQWKKS